jgi:HEAT repeat protein
MVRVPKLGRPVYVVLGLAILVLVVIYGGMALWPRIETYQGMRALDQLVRDRSQPAEARARAAEMLAEYGPDAAPYMLEAAHDAEGRVREKAYAYLASLEPLTEEALVICLTALKEDGEPRARASAATSLGPAAYVAREGPPHRRQRILDCLIEAGRDRSPIVRHAAVRAMIGANAVDIDPGPWLEDSDRSVRLAAAEAIFWLSPADRGRAVPTLQAMILQAGPDRPAEVMRPLGLLFRVDPSACRSLVPTFVTWLRHDDAEARGRVVVWLANLGSLAQDATPALEAMLDRGTPASRTRVAFAIINIDPAGCDRAAAALLALLGDAAAHPRDRGLALPTFDAMFRHRRVPARLRDETLKNLRTIRDQPDIHPELGLRIRQFIEYHERPRRQGPGRGASARLISAH